MSRFAGLVAVSVVLAGCLGQPQVANPAAGLPDGVRAVVALIDTGINPWHEAFRVPPGDARFSRPPGEAVAVPSAFRATIEALGPSAYDAFEPRTLYWFEGTRVLAISWTQDLPPEFTGTTLFRDDPHPIHDDVNHGTATASALAMASPNAWIVMVETNALSLPGYRWAVEQDWIDIISTSRGSAGHVPSNGTEQDRWAEALGEAVGRGKLVFAAGGNTPDPNLLGGEESPPWVISVGGAEEEHRGASPLTSQPVDVVADLTWPALARNDSNTETFAAKGTSFGAPYVAGQVAEALHHTRTRLGHRGGIQEGALVHTPSATLTNSDFRRALNLTATYWNTTDHAPRLNTSQFPTLLAYDLTNPALPHAPGTPAGPWIQMGWGHVGPGTAQAMVQALLGTAPQKPDAAAYMERTHQARAAVWDARQAGRS